MSALRDTKGKLDWAMLFEYMPLAMQELCKARMFGARYYTKEGRDGRSNWRDSIGTAKHQEFMKGCVRGNLSHSFKFLWGEDRDAPQDNVHHLAYSALNSLFALEYALSDGPVEDGAPSEENLAALGASIAPPSPTLREILQRGDEMPQWLIALIEFRTEHGYERMIHVHERIDLHTSPEGYGFWCDVQRFQYRATDTLPDEPKRTTGGVKNV